MEKPNMSLAKIEGEEIVIRIPKAVIKACFDYALDHAFGNHDYNISEEAVFINEFVSVLNRESETGETVLHLALDKAIVTAVENGCEGIEGPDLTHNADGKRIDGYGDPANGEYNAFLADDGGDIPCD